MKAYALLSADQPASLVDLPDPNLPEDGVLVSVRAASVNGFDVFQASGALTGMMEHAFPTVVGRDFAGVVAAVGPRRDDFTVGDEVLGFVPTLPPLHDGTFAQSIAGSGLVLAVKPAELSFEVAAAIPLAGVTALDAVDAVAPKAGDTVLVDRGHRWRGFLRRPARGPAGGHGHRQRQAWRGGGLRARPGRIRHRGLRIW